MLVTGCLQKLWCLSADVKCKLKPNRKAPRAAMENAPENCTVRAKRAPRATFNHRVPEATVRRGLQLLQTLGWRCVECAIPHQRDAREEQHRYIRGANKQ